MHATRPRALTPYDKRVGGDFLAIKSLAPVAIQRVGCQQTSGVDASAERTRDSSDCNVPTAILAFAIATTVCFIEIRARTPNRVMDESSPVAVGRFGKDQNRLKVDSAPQPY